MTPGTIPGLSAPCYEKLEEKGYTKLSDFEGVYFPDIYKILPFGQAKILFGYLLKNGIKVRFAAPDWSEDRWRQFVDHLAQLELVTWREVALLICGELNPPQVGTSIASDESFQAKYPPRQIMQHVMTWFYAQNGKCANCGTRLDLQKDHIRSYEDFQNAGENPEEADRLENLQLLCRRCNVIKRPSHVLGGISFAPAQSVLMRLLKKFFSPPLASG